MLDQRSGLNRTDGTHIGYTLEEEICGKLGLTDTYNLVDHACVLYFDLDQDPDGDAMTKGWDTDFDGIIDMLY